MRKRSSVRLTITHAIVLSGKCSYLGILITRKLKFGMYNKSHLGARCNKLHIYSTKLAGSSRLGFLSHRRRIDCDASTGLCLAMKRD